MFVQSALFLTFLAAFGGFPCTASQAVTSVDWELQQVVSSVIDRENRIKSALGDLQKKLSSNIDSFKLNAALSALVTAMETMKDLAVKLITINNYGPYQPTSNCDDVISKIGTIKFDIDLCARVNVNNAVNATLLMVQYNIVYATYLANYYLLSDDQRQSVQCLLTSWTVVNDEYNQYTLTLVMAIYKYNVIYVELVTLKKSLCSCSLQLSAASVSNVASLDNTLKQIQEMIDQVEGRIRNVSTDAYNKANVASSDTKSNAYFTQLINTLNTITTLLRGYQKITTTDVINPIINCDDVASRSAFTKYKWQKYYQAQIEASKNATVILVQYSTLNSLYAINLLSLSNKQKEDVQFVIAALLSLSDAYKQYILSLITAQVKLLQLQPIADTTRSESCKCDGNTLTSKLTY